MRASESQNNDHGAASVEASQIIPVGQEPRGPCAASGRKQPAVVARRTVGRRRTQPDTPTQSARGPRNSNRSPVLPRLKERANTLRVFTVETARTLRRAELLVWLAIYNCEFHGVAEIGYSRLCKITDLSRRHVGKAVKSLETKGLLEIVVRGRFQPPRKHQLEKANVHEAYGTVCLGQPSVYRIHARPVDTPAGMAKPVASEPDSPPALN